VDRFDQLPLAQVMHRVGGRAHAGQNDHVRFVQSGRHRGDIGPGSDALHRAHHGAQITGSVVENDYVKIGQTGIAHRPSVSVGLRCISFL